MTVIAVAKAQGIVAVVCDTPKGTWKDGAYAFNTKVDKICELRGTYASVCGDDQALAAAYQMTSFREEGCPDLLADDAFSRLVELVALRWSAQQGAENGPKRSSGFTLVHCDVGYVGYRAFDLTYGARPAVLVGDGECHVLYGGHSVIDTVEAAQSPEELVEGCKARIKTADARARLNTLFVEEDHSWASVGAVPYALPPEYSGVAIAPNGQVARKLPFSSPAYELACLFGLPEPVAFGKQGPSGEELAKLPRRR